MMESREDILEEKMRCDIKLASLKAALTSARADARVNGRYMQPTRYAQLELECAALAQRSQKLQSRLGAMKRNRAANINDCFREAAAKELPERTFKLILEMACDIKRARDHGESISSDKGGV